MTTGQIFLYTIASPYVQCSTTKKARCYGPVCNLGVRNEYPHTAWMPNGRNYVISGHIPNPRVYVNDNHYQDNWQPAQNVRKIAEFKILTTGYSRPWLDVFSNYPCGSCKVLSLDLRRFWLH